MVFLIFFYLFWELAYVFMAVTRTISAGRITTLNANMATLGQIKELLRKRKKKQKQPLGSK